jgi:DNA replication protein DnaC
MNYEFKLMHKIAKKQLSPEENPQIVGYIAEVNKWKKLENPTLSTALECSYCGAKEHYAPLMSLDKDSQRVWICAEINCETTKLKNLRRAMVIPVASRRALEWDLFCELTGIGDRFHDLRFESIRQSTARMDYMLKFGANPSSILFMHGSSGSGKTYAAMGICELFTRYDVSVIFTSQRNMYTKWLETFNGDTSNNYIQKVTQIRLLVIDDLGIGELTDKFKEFLMELVNSRQQWTNRGTVITTNLDPKTLIKMFGQPFSQRINMGMEFEFKEETRRKKMIL